MRGFCTRFTLRWSPRRLQKRKTISLAEGIEEVSPRIIGDIQPIWRANDKFYVVLKKGVRLIFQHSFWR